jgi:hypothetical protein
MAVVPYPREVEMQMKVLYDSLNEKDRRRYAAIEATKLGRGGHRYIVELLGCDYKTIRRGFEDLKNPPALPRGRIRKKGGTQVLSC